MSKYLALTLLIALPLSAQAQGRFDQPLPGLPPGRGLDFEIGRAMFDRLWVTAPSSTKSTDGLGPLYNARSCVACHPRGGRGTPDGEGLVLHLTEPGAPVYGHQLQTRGIPGLRAEGRVDITYDRIDVPLAGGETVQLRAPRYDIADPGYGPLPDGTRISPRMAPPLIGLGLIEAIPEAQITARADPTDADGDGISGRASRVWRDGAWHLGRFGLKAGMIDLPDQISAAFALDLGLGTPARPDAWGDCTDAQPDCRALPDGNSGSPDGVEVTQAIMDLVVLHNRYVAPPARRNTDDPAVMRGEALFADLGCAGCHTPSYTTAPDGDPVLAGQTIAPYTDLLLHDMGPGLADHRPQGTATGTEWRTPPLWGIGLTESLSGHTTYLHDGRARSLIEAILWHGGEAARARDGVIDLPAADRTDLIAFLESL